MVKEDIDKLKNTAEKSIKGMMRGDDPDLFLKRIPTGIFVLDRILKGGFARGRTHTMFGIYGGGKTTLSYFFLGNAQRIVENAKCAIIDMEHRYEPKFAADLGIDVSKMEVYRPGSGEESLDLLIELAKRNYDVVVFDSIAAIASKKRLEESMDQKFMGDKAVMINQALEKLNPINNNTVVILLNQLRHAIGGIMSPGVNKSMPGGEGLYHYSHMVAEVNRESWITQSTKKDSVGFNIRFFVTQKSVICRPMSECIIPFNFDTCKIDDIAATINLAIEEGVISQTGAWYIVGNKKVMGKQGLYDFFVSDLDKLDEIKKNLS